jgi:hypothetical protein
MFTKEMTAGSDGRYPYGYAALVVSGNSTITNCYIYGARNNIQVGNGNVTIQNTVTECGSLSNIHITTASGNTVVLDNVTTIQRQVTDDFGVGNTMLGFGILVGDNETTAYPSIKITGDLRQYNWVSKADADKVTNDYAKQAINSAVTDKEIAGVYEKKHLISNKYNAIDMVRYVNRKVDLFLKNKKIEDINVHFKLLVLSFIQTQKLFFGEDKIIKYKLNQYENINLFYNTISSNNNNKEVLIGNIKDIMFVPERGISNNNNKSINSSNNSNGSSNNEENVSVRSNKFIPQVIGFGALFSVLYYIKNKII